MPVEITDEVAQRFFFFVIPTGEWKARFDPRFTSKGVFYLDNERMVDVEVMEDAKHPLSLFMDNELEAQVQYSFVIYADGKEKHICLT